MTPDSDRSFLVYVGGFLITAAGLAIAKREMPDWFLCAIWPFYWCLCFLIFIAWALGGRFGQ